MELLYVSRFAPFDSIGHAGGKTHNYYIKELAKSYRIRLVALCDEKDRKKINIEKYGIENSIIYIDNSLKAKICRRLKDIYGIIFKPELGYELMGKTMRTIILKKLMELKKSGYYPKIIILEWTQIVIIASEIKKIFPKADICASEHDVTFLSYKRRFDYAKSGIKKWYRKRAYSGMMKKELKELSYCRYIYTQSEKDTNILIDNGITKDRVFTISPYFTDFSSLKYNGKNKDIIFFGAMDRAENYKSALWFIEKVMPLLDKDIRFIVIGNKPHASLQAMASERVIITGFLDENELYDYFQNSRCLVAPLVIGGGIKVKILEAFSAGIPVLTNDIGIEGIPAINEESYIYCKSVDDYVNKVNIIMSDVKYASNIGENGRKIISDTYSLKASVNRINQYLLNR